eukprot:7210037-Pyramimonas_sp.AAC.1
MDVSAPPAARLSPSVHEPCARLTCTQHPPARGAAVALLRKVTLRLPDPPGTSAARIPINRILADPFTGL